MQNSWEEFAENLYYDEDLGLMLDFSRMDFAKSYLEDMASGMNRVFGLIEEMEGGSIANPDEGRMVGHYWLRNPDLAPSPELRSEVRTTLSRIREFVGKVHRGEIAPEQGGLFKNVLLIGIGGSSLGPKFIADALGADSDPMTLYFVDNTDPDGMDRIFSRLLPELDQTLCLVISKSGGTIETRNGMLEAKALYEKNNLNFARHAVRITQVGSALDRLGEAEGWLDIFPMWDWVGGRTSVLSAVGLVDLALQGIDIDQLLQGAMLCDERTRIKEIRSNPAALLALMWYKATGGQGGKQMVMLPYKDRLALLSNYLQQLIMESLGKERDLEGRIVHQGIAVYGNKGSTDQHSYVQQLLEGPNNFFATFVEVLKDRKGKSPLLAENSTSGDYLQAFLLGTRNALTQKGRESITITIPEVNPFTVGVLIALFERTVSIYALLIHINAYHQPGVELGKKGAGEAIHLKNNLLEFLKNNRTKPFTAEEIAKALGRTEDLETIFKLLLHLRANPDHGVLYEKSGSLLLDRYYIP